MPEENEILTGTSFDVENFVQIVYGSVFSYGDLVASGSIILTPTGSLPLPNESAPGQIINYQSETTGSLFFFNGINWKQIMLVS